MTSQPTLIDQPKTPFSRNLRNQFWALKIFIKTTTPSPLTPKTDQNAATVNPEPPLTGLEGE
jgi:hypothetical protein